MRHQRSFYIFLLICFILLASFTSPRAGRSETGRRRPNVVLVIIDTLRSDKLGCYGFAENTSPEIDEFAQGGVRFDRVLAQCSWTRPSIGSLLTSLYPRSLGLYDEHDQILNDASLTLAEILQSHGYTTLGITANPHINSVFNFHQGFDHYIDSEVVFVGMKAGKRQVPDDRKAFTPAADILKELVDLVETGRGSPCYIQINLMDVHEHWREEGSVIREEFTKLFLESPEARYLQSIRQVSKDLGDFVRRFTATEGREDTLFVITSDHGEGLGDHPHVPNSAGHGRLLYESQLMVPLILYHPTWEVKRRIVQEPVRLVDVMPTILDFLDISAPKEIVGKSLLPMIGSDSSEMGLPEGFVAETYFRGLNKIAVYSSQWKYIENRDGYPGVNEQELQPTGVKEDGRLTDAINTHPEVAQRMQEYLKAWRRRFRKVEPTPHKEDMAGESMEQLRTETYRKLRSLGYLE